jgi:Spy/CpxP family protein refolding chaperone
MKTLKVLTIVAITGLVGATAANACPSNKGNGMNCPKHEKCGKQHKGMMGKHDKRKEMKEVFQKLDLTAEQKSAMQADRKSMREYRQAQRGKMQGAHGMAGMNKFISADGFDKQGYIDMATQRSQKRIEMRAAMFEKKINILTEEQRVKLMTLLEEKSK